MGRLAVLIPTLLASLLSGRRGVRLGADGCGRAVGAEVGHADGRDVGLDADTLLQLVGVLGRGGIHQ